MNTTNTTEKKFFLAAVEQHKKKNLKDAANLYENVLKINPNHFESNFFLGTLSAQFKNFDKSIELLQKAIEMNSNYPDAHNNLGLAFKQNNNYEKAKKCFEKVIEIEPNHFSAHNNLGNIFKEFKENEKARKCYEKAITINPNYSDAHNNLGTLFHKLDDKEKAIKCYEKVIEINPNHIEANNNLGTIFRELKEFKKAIYYAEKAIESNSNHSRSYFNLGYIFYETGENEKARKCYEKVIEIDPKYSDAHGNLMEIYEATNQDEKLKHAILKAETLIKDDPVINLFKGRILFKNEKILEAIKILEQISFQNNRIIYEQSRLLTLAECYNRIKNADQAFEYFVKVNNISFKLKKKNIDKNKFLKKIEDRKDFFNKSKIKKWPSINSQNEKDKPVFIIGFPRSGTTLLDTILSSHPLIEVIEEKPAVANLVNSLNKSINSDFKYLEKIEKNKIDETKKIYLDSLKSEIKNIDNSKIYIDKLPLNIINVGEIYRIFPNARFILSLRHPCDCVLSCFMQNFELNDAMANFLNLQDAAKLYNSVMNLWNEYISIFSINYHTVRYEDIVSDFNNTIKSTLNFLNLSWDESVLEYYKTARKKEKINTPSYSQVIKPIYSHASDRWKIYNQQIKNIYPILEPWIKKFNY